MKPGDLIEICSQKIRPPGGALTAVKFFERLKRKTHGLRGIVICDNGTTVSALFGEDVIVISKKHAKVVDNRANGD